MPTPLSSELQRLAPGAVVTGEHERGMYARDLWPLSTVRFRRGELGQLPAAVVRPDDAEVICRVLEWCTTNGVAVLPYGGGSGVCGGVLVDPEALEGRQAIVLDLKRWKGVERVSVTDRWCTVRSGTLGMDYEETLQTYGLTGGHYPQSLYPSTVGGWLACRSAGQASTAYGKGEDLVAGLDVALASGAVVELRPQPSSAAGPDLAKLFLGSEGTLGVILRATLRVVPEPAQRRFRSFRFERFADGLDGVREVIQQGLRPAIVRLYDEADTALSFPEEAGCVLVCVFEGALASTTEEACEEILTATGGTDLGPGPAEAWLERRYRSAYELANVLRSDGLLGPNAIADTMEVAGAWSRIGELYEAVGDALARHTVVHLCHASHVYPDGACLYFTFALQGDDEEDAEDRYHAVWDAGMEACLYAGGTITHHHGIGRLKARWLRRELGEEGWRLLGDVKRTLDPAGILNPGNMGLG